MSNSWDFRAPAGSVLMTDALRAMQAELPDATFRVLSATTLFSSRLAAGPLGIDVEMLRKSGAAAQFRARVSADGSGEVANETLATFVQDRSGLDFTDSAPPDVPPPDAAPQFSARVPYREGPPPRFFANVESRLALGHDWWSPGWQAGPARFARWFRYKRPQRLPDGRLDPLAIPPLADTMPPSIVQKLGPGFEPFVAPSLDLTVHFLGDTPKEWLLVHAHTRRVRGGTASADVEIWDDEQRLIAYGTQTMMLRKPPLKRE